MGLVHTMKGDGMADYKKTAEGVLAAIGGAPTWRLPRTV